MTGTIRTLDARLIRIPLSRPWGPSVTDISVVEVVVTDEDGRAGHGFSWTPSIGGAAVLAHLQNDITRFVLGRTTDPAHIWQPLWEHLHEGGSGGITTIALAGLDLALWDLAARRSDISLVAFLGRRHDSVEVYGSGVNLHYTLDELTAQARRWVDAGFNAVKVKVGSSRLEDDITRIRAVRDIIGPDRRLMIDANQRWDIAQAIRAVNELAQFDLAWIEEPLRADDLTAHITLKERIDVPIALGENVHTLYRFAEFIDAGVPSVIQPNVVRVGGITPFRAIADLAERSGVAVAPHLLPELSGQLALTLPTATLVESVEDAAFADLGVLDGPSPVSIDGRRLTDTGRPGLGLLFAPDITR